MAAFSEHEEAIKQFNSTTCTTTLQDGTRCVREHCNHTLFACHLGNDAASFNNRYCCICRMGLHFTLEQKKDQKRENLKKKVLQGEHVFLFTGYQKGSHYEYEYVNTGEKFECPEEPSTDAEVQRISNIWLTYKDEIKERAATIFRKPKQTKLTSFFK